MLDPASAPLAALDRALARLVRRWRTASHAVGSRPDGIDDATLEWWVRAHRARWDRRMEDTAERPAGDVAPVPLRKPPR